MLARVSNAVMPRAVSDVSIFLSREVPAFAQRICSYFPVLRCLGDRRVMAGLVILYVVLSAGKKIFRSLSEATVPAQDANTPEPLQRFRNAIKEYQRQLNLLAPGDQDAYTPYEEGFTKTDRLCISPAAKLEYFKKFANLFTRVSCYLIRETDIAFSDSAIQADLDALTKKITKAAEPLKQHSNDTFAVYDDKAFDLPTLWIKEAGPIFEKLLQLPMKAPRA